jgi:hypothetical protein
MSQSKDLARPTRRAWSAIVLGLCALRLVIGATIRLKQLPFGRGASQNRACQKDPGSCWAGDIGLICIAVALWLGRFQRNFDYRDGSDDSQNSNVAP